MKTITEVINTRAGKESCTIADVDRAVSFLQEQLTMKISRLMIRSCSEELSSKYRIETEINGFDGASFWGYVKPKTSFNLTLKMGPDEESTLMYLLVR